MNKTIIILFVVIVLLFAVIFRIKIAENEKQAEIEQLTEERDDLSYDNKKKKSELGKELNDEEIKKIAKDKLDYVEPNSEYYYGD